MVRLKPPCDLRSVEEPSPFDLVGGELSSGGEPVDLLGLAAEDGGELVDGEEGRQHGFHGKLRTISDTPDGFVTGFG